MEQVVQDFVAELYLKHPMGWDVEARMRRERRISLPRDMMKFLGNDIEIIMMMDNSISSNCFQIRVSIN